MLTTIQAVFVFALFVVPGFLLRSGYVRTRAHGLAERDLYALARAVVGSAFLIAIMWWWNGSNIVNWFHAGTVRSHENAIYAHVAALLILPYPIGLLAGSLAGLALQILQRIREFFDRPNAQPNNAGRRLFKALDQSGLLSAPTVWDNMWNERFKDQAAPYVRVGLKSGREIVGTFGEGSWVGLSPEPRQLYLSKEYRPDIAGGWEPVPDTKGVFVDASEIEFISFAAV